MSALPLRTGKNFNSRSSARGDHAFKPPCFSENISIHAPPRGATRRRASYCSGGDFNSRPSARGDSAGGLPTVPAVYFNSRPSARGDERMRLQRG